MNKKNKKYTKVVGQMKKSLLSELSNYLQEKELNELTKELMEKDIISGKGHVDRKGYGGRPKTNWSKLTKEQRDVQMNRLMEGITLIREPHKNQIRGCVTMFGRKRFQHIGKDHLNGKIHMNTLIGKMTDEQLYDEFRFKMFKNQWKLLSKSRG